MTPERARLRLRAESAAPPSLTPVAVTEDWSLPGRQPGVADAVPRDGRTSSPSSSQDYQLRCFHAREEGAPDARVAIFWQCRGRTRKFSICPFARELSTDCRERTSLSVPHAAALQQISSSSVDHRSKPDRGHRFAATRPDTTSARPHPDQVAYAPRLVSRSRPRSCDLHARRAPPSAKATGHRRADSRGSVPIASTTARLGSTARRSARAVARVSTDQHPGIWWPLHVLAQIGATGAATEIGPLPARFLDEAQRPKPNASTTVSTPWPAGVPSPVAPNSLHSHEWNNHAAYFRRGVGLRGDLITASTASGTSWPWNTAWPHAR